ELAPPKPEAGSKWEISEGVARQFSRVLGPGDEDSMPRPHEVTAMKLTAKVGTVEDGVAGLVYEGTLKGSHLNQAKKRTYGEVKLTGVGRYDVKARRLRSLVWVFDGVYKGPPPYDQPRSYSALVEWSREQPKK